MLSLFGASGFAAAKKLASVICEADPGVPPASDAPEAGPSSTHARGDAEALEVRGVLVAAARPAAAGARGGAAADQQGPVFCL
jgi:hypothetical protein